MIKICLSLKDKIRKEGKERKKDVVSLPGFISRLVAFPLVMSWMNFCRLDKSSDLMILISPRLVLELLSLYEVSDKKEEKRESKKDLENKGGWSS